MSPNSSVTPVSAWRLTASAMVKMTAATSRMSPDTARVSKMNIHSMTRVSDCPCLQRRYLFSEQWSSSGTTSIICDVDYAKENTYNFHICAAIGRRSVGAEAVRAVNCCVVTSLSL